MISTMGEDSIIDETQHSVDKYNKEAILQEIKLKVEKKVSTDNIQAKDVEEIYDDIEEVLTEFGTYDEHKM